MKIFTTLLVEITLYQRDTYTSTWQCNKCSMHLVPGKTGVHVLNLLEITRYTYKCRLLVHNVSYTWTAIFFYTLLIFSCRVFFMVFFIRRLVDAIKYICRYYKVHAHTSYLHISTSSAIYEYVHSIYLSTSAIRRRYYIFFYTRSIMPCWKEDNEMLEFNTIERIVIPPVCWNNKISSSSSSSYVHIRTIVFVSAWRLLCILTSTIEIPVRTKWRNKIKKKKRANKNDY